MGEMPYYDTVQYAWGGLLDAQPLHDIHLHARGMRHTLCGRALFAEAGPGWSRNGGVTDPEARACRPCLLARHPEVPIAASSMFRGVFA